MNTTELVLSIGQLIGGVVIGAFCGVLPLVIGIMKKKTLLGVLGMAMAVVFGGICTCVFHLPAFLSIIPAVIITLTILLIEKKKDNE